ncbi:MAG: M1 family metallopeptidase [Bacteroidota bacterium]
MKKVIVFLFVTIIVGCTPKTASDNILPIRPNDPHSASRPAEAMTTHLNLNLKVDFDTKTLEGFARYKIDNNQAHKLILDVRDLDIQKVTIGAIEKETTFELTEPKPFLGSGMSIDILPETEMVTVYYKTSPDAAALDWLNPQQTAEKTDPFLFTQGQAILTRTWIPCQDSPGIRITYDATIEVPIGLLAVMSAENPQSKNESGVYTFKMEQPIPPYLMALAVGNLNFGAVGERTGVYAEPSMLEKSVYEFSDMELMLIEAEKLYGPYLWDRYDVIVLPPSFPFGGMENPRLTFATPTIIAGDRSLTSLIAHELAHSWSGNLVTNATWDDFWLNEGFTVYFERRIMEALYGEDYTNMLAMLGMQDLEEEVTYLGFGHADTHLKLHLAGRDPDEGMTDVAYEKGASFLTMLEKEVGRENFDKFLKDYFETFKFKTITSEEFVNYMEEHLIGNYKLAVNWEEWIYGPGIPHNCPKTTSDRFALVDAQQQLLREGTPPSELKTVDWTTHEWLHFIRGINTETDLQTMEALDETFNFSESGNSEILSAWLILSIRNGYGKTLLPKVEDFLVEVGRRKFLTPMYKALKETDQLDVAREIYKKARPNYHSVSTQTIDALLEFSAEG